MKSRGIWALLFLGSALELWAQPWPYRQASSSGASQIPGLQRTAGWDASLQIILLRGGPRTDVEQALITQGYGDVDDEAPYVGGLEHPRSDGGDYLSVQVRLQRRLTDMLEGGLLVGLSTRGLTNGYNRSTRVTADVGYRTYWLTPVLAYRMLPYVDTFIGPSIMLAEIDLRLGRATFLDYVRTIVYRPAPGFTMGVRLFSFSETGLFLELTAQYRYGVFLRSPELTLSFEDPETRQLVTRRLRPFNLAFRYLSAGIGLGYRF
ncbi:MAG: hypothetical protein RMK61_05470 [Bacteroidota bacterium]|nr:hypothetical protein [Bacteroidota bacterium]MDW8137880.1 hypothetical protein [Bacteroidota bacterium]